ncbi:unnamed protein product, partial [Mesorhabditis belari]|uniref:Uncharacterized protein n=1 Tax=Mesorhabditis belari TaxID=2138241 RepID=A0AAF3FK22_9BILA
MPIYDTAVHEQKLNFLRAHVTELNRRMVALMETSEKGFPTHVNLNKGHMPQPNDDQLVWLHRQNQLLSSEVTEKNKQLDELKRASQSLSHLSLNSHRMSQMSNHRPSTVQIRPSAFVRPATHSISPQHHSISASPIKIYDTLM